ncbi:MAG: hypothetical protein JNK84_09825 [Phreatobacter sp.]|uniref:DUF5681 domain-containing protein n=1 Tax=Phreatobacter sp. TaxID=1966341 RepID=UPI001A362CAA|nr:DUF5681 domain-containing protein [Phreatobacter sp.]MBL8569374.1 hypothetical protein [Phreatobacter sp.]
MKRREPPDALSNTYAVGYGKPPVATRFQKGKSGNPNGRPRKAAASKQPGQSLTDAVLDLARQSVTVREGEDHRQISGREVVLKSIMKSAASGNSRSQRHMMELFAEAEAAETARIEEDNRVWTRYVEVKKAEIADCARRGVTPPRMVPHPEDIYIFEGEPVVFVGPRTEKEADDLDKLAWLNEALLLHYIWETDVLPKHPEASGKGISLAGLAFYYINPLLPKRMRLSDEDISRQIGRMSFCSRARERAMVADAWQRALPGHSIKLKPVLLTEELLKSSDVSQPVRDQLAKFLATIS